MSFLSPLALLLSAAIVVPLALHFFRRRSGRRVEFPAARYLARAEHEHSRRLRVRNLLLLMLRVATVLVIALAAAGLLGGQGGAHPPTALVILLDNSLSTTVVVDGRPVLDALREAARRIAHGAAADDRLWLVTADGAVTSALSDRGALVRAIDAVEPLAGRGELATALETARGLTRTAEGRSPRVALLTDAQASAWTDDAPRAGRGAIVLFTARGPAPSNRAVLHAEARPARWTPAGAVAARVLAADSVSYRITIAGIGAEPRTLARGTATGGAEVLVRASPPERGWISGLVEIAPDELRGDDARHFAARVGAPPAVLAHPSAGPFAASAVDALAGAGRVRPLPGIAVVGADELTRLPAVIVAPADPVRTGAANRALERAGVPWRLEEARRDTTQSRSGDARLRGIPVAFRYSLALRQSSAPAETLATAGGGPWIVGGPGYVFVGSPLVSGATALPIRAGFLPWLGDVLSQRLAAEPGAVQATAPSAPLVRPAGADALESPDGTRRVLAGDTIAAPARPGVYFFLRGGRREGALVVNAEEQESVLDRLTARELAARLGRDVRVVREENALVAQAFAAGGARRAMATPLLGLAMILLLAESLFARQPRLAGARTA